MTFVEIAKVGFNLQYHKDAAFHAEVHRLDVEWPTLLDTIARFAATEWQRNLLNTVTFKTTYLRAIADRCAAAAAQLRLIEDNLRNGVLVEFNMDTNEGRD